MPTGTVQPRASISRSRRETEDSLSSLPRFASSRWALRVPSGPLADRQLWWLATVMATAGGLALLAFTRSLGGAVAAVALLALPHLIGAPQLAEVTAAVPDRLSHRFAAAVMVTSLLSWSVLGGLAGWLYGRFARPTG